MRDEAELQTGVERVDGDSGWGDWSGSVTVSGLGGGGSGDCAGNTTHSGTGGGCGELSVLSFSTSALSLATSAAIASRLFNAVFAMAAGSNDTLAWLTVAVGPSSSSAPCLSSSRSSAVCNV